LKKTTTQKPAAMMLRWNSTQVGVCSNSNKSTQVPIEVVES